MYNSLSFVNDFSVFFIYFDASWGTSFFVVPWKLWTAGGTTASDTANHYWDADDALSKDVSDNEYKRLDIQEGNISKGKTSSLQKGPPNLNT
jgi:hypothetical protein